MKAAQVNREILCPRLPSGARDCENCPYDDCIADELEHRDYVEQKERDKLLFPKTAKQEKVAAHQKAYYEANREKRAAYQKAYYEANREKIMARRGAST